MNEFRNIHLLRIRILIERKIFFIAIEYFLMISRRQESTSACEALVHFVDADATELCIALIDLRSSAGFTRLYDF
jgi:hypothetical protein